MALGNTDLQPRRRRRTLLIRILTTYTCEILGSVCIAMGIVIISFSFSISPLWKQLLSLSLGVVLILGTFIMCCLVLIRGLFQETVDPNPSANAAELSQLIPWPREESIDDGDRDGVQENPGQQGGRSNGVQENPRLDVNNDGVMPTEMSASREAEADGAAGSGGGTLGEGYEARFSGHADRRGFHRRSTEGIGF